MEWDHSADLGKAIVPPLNSPSQSTSQNDSSKDENYTKEDSSISQWLKLGITKSEIKHQNKDSYSRSMSRDGSCNSLQKEDIHDRSLSETGSHSPVVVNRSIQTEKQKTPSYHSEKRRVDKFLQKYSEEDHLKGEEHFLKMFAGLGGRNGEGSSGSTLSPTCSFIKTLLESEIPIREKGVLRSIDNHRHLHIQNVRKELSRVKKLSEYLRSERSIEMRSPRVLLSSDRNTDSEESIRSLNRIRNSKVPSRAEPTENRLEVKMDELILTFQKILERMEEENRNDIKGSREPGSGSVPSKVLAKSEPCSSFKPPVSYFLPLPSLQHPIWIRPPSAVSPVLEKEKSDCDAIPDGKEVRSVLRNDSLPRVSLQEICKLNHSEFLQRAEDRQLTLLMIRKERQKRAELKREWLKTHAPEEYANMEPLLPARPRLMSTREMRAQTLKKYRKLPEVQLKKLQRKTAEEKKTNRVLSHCFARKLRQGVLKGRVNWSMWEDNPRI